MSGNGGTQPCFSIMKRQAIETPSGGDDAKASSSNTLLPRPVASLVTLLTQSTSLSLRLCTYLGSFAIDSARATTLTGLELSRAVVEGVLIRAGREVVERTSDDHGRNEAESLLEKSVSNCYAG